MTAAVVTDAGLSGQHLGLLFQYTVEAYKTFEKLAENLPNPLAARMFKQFALDERQIRDLLEMKAASSGDKGARATLGADLLFQDMLEGDLSGRATAEFLISRERTMLRRLEDIAKNATQIDRFLLIHVASTKRAHIVALERELELLRLDSDWLKREDAEWRIVHGPRER